MDRASDFGSDGWGFESLRARSMKITYVEPPLNLEPSRIFPRHPPQYALYSAALLRREGFDVAVVDAFHEDLTVPATVRKVLDTRPDLVLIVPYDYTRETLPAVTVALAAGLAAQAPGLPVGLAGSVDVDHFRRPLEAAPALAFALTGEYELSMLRVARQGAQGLSDVPGALFRDGPGIAYAGPAEPVKDLDALPWPAWDLIDFAKYAYVAHRFRQTPMYPLLASRGCPYACDCCKESKYSKITRFRIRSVENVMAEIRWAVEHWGAREIQFSDATFGLKAPWVHELCDALVASGLGLTWSALSRVDVMTPELLDHMGRAGCWNVLYGVESANQHALDLVHKRIRVEQVAPALRATRAAGIEVTCSFILGLPGETRKDILRTLDWAVELDPDYAQFFILKYYSEDGALDRWGRVDPEWDFGRFDFRGPVFIPSAIRDKAELKELQRRAYRRFYLRPGYVLRRLPKLLAPRQIGRSVQGLVTLLKASIGR